MKRSLITLTVGAVPVAGLALISHFLPRAGDDESVRLGICTALGALWGLAAGVLRRSLLRAIIGLNVGALCGYVFSLIALPKESVSEPVAIAGLVASGALLGAALNFQRESLWHAFKGMFAGVLAFGFMGCAAWVVAQMFSPNLLGWTVMCLIPFGGGMAIFIGLVGKEPQATPVATSRADGKVNKYDNERGRVAGPIPGIGPTATAAQPDSTAAADVRAS
jgi:hypothetical protein